MKLASTINVKTHAKMQPYADRMRFVIVLIIKHHANVHQALKQIPHQIKVVFAFRIFVKRLNNVRKITCVLLTNAICHALTQALVQLANVAQIICAQKSAIQTTIAFRVKFVMMEFVFLAAHLMLIVRIPKFAFNQNANVEKASLEHHLDAVILMNVVNNFVIHLRFVKIRLDHINVFVQHLLLVILTANQDAKNQVNATKIMIALIIWLVPKVNVLINAR